MGYFGHFLRLGGILVIFFVSAVFRSFFKVRGILVIFKFRDILLIF